MEHIGGDNDAQDYRDCNLDGVHSRVQRLRELRGGYVVRAPEHPCPRNQREYPADQEYRARAHQPFRREARHESHQSRRKQGRREGTDRAQTHHKQICAPAEHSHNAACGAVLPRNSEQHGKRGCTHKGREHLDREPARERVGEHSSHADHSAAQPAVEDEREAHSGCNAEEHHQSVDQARHPRKVILVRDIPQAVGKSHARNQQNQSPDYHVSEAAPHTGGEQQYAEKGPDESRADIAKSLGQVRSADLDHEKVKHHGREQTRRAVRERPAEYRTEPPAAESRSKQLHPHRGRRHALDLLQPFAGRPEGQLQPRDVARELVHRHDLVEPGPLDGNELGVRIGTPGGKYAIAQDEELLTLLAIVRRDPLHRLLHSGDLRPVLEQYPARFGSEAEDLFAVDFLHFKKSGLPDCKYSFFCYFCASVSQ